MKKPLLISLSLLSLGLISGIYAQTTTGTSIVDKMKAVAHSFTLATSLNPTDTGLTSDPVKGKKTGDILTAGEWNRVLELVGQGGGGDSVYFTATHWGTSGFIPNIPANLTSNAQGTLITNYTASQNDAMNKATGIFTAPVAGYYVLNGHSNYFTTADANTFVQLISSGGKSVLGTRGAPSTMPMSEVTTIWYLNAGETVGLYLWNDKPSTNVYARFTGILINGSGGGGGTTTAGGSVQIVEGGLIKTSPKTISNWDLITLEGSWNSGGGDAAPTGGYIYKLGGQAKLAYVEASGISKDITLTTTAQNVHNLTVKLSGSDVVIDPSSTNTLAYIVWKFSGGSGGSTATCPSGFVAVGSYCIEPTMNAVGKTWYEAAVACTDKGAQLCHWSEWSAACQKNKLTDVVFGAAGKYEWIDDYSIGNQGIADPIVYSNCKYLSRQADTTTASNTGYRCCMPQK